MQRSFICLSSRATLRLLSNLGEGHDSAVLAWRHNLLPRLQNSIDLVCSRLMDDLQNNELVYSCMHMFIVVIVEIMQIGRYVIVILGII